MDRRLVVASVVGVVVGAVLGGFYGGYRTAGGAGGGGGTLASGQADLVLAMDGGQCTWLVKQDAIVERGKNIVYQIRNKCGSTVTVTLGNFRKTQNGSNTDCANAVETGVTWPFTSGSELADRQQSIPGGGGTIVLRGAIHSGGSTEDKYFFDACIGNRIVDPRLVIE
ncbi:MAG TPA: hypothetical protein VF147_01125 [Vicinamibacterales bacterium]